MRIHLYVYMALGPGPLAPGPGPRAWGPGLWAPGPGRITPLQATFAMYCIHLHIGMIYI